MATLRVPDSLHVPETEKNFKATPVAWFTEERGADGKMRCGQDEKELRYLHLPEDLEDVDFDLNKPHPEDEFNLEAFNEGYGMHSILNWIKSTQRNLGGTDFVIGERHLLLDLLLLPYLSSVPYRDGFDNFVTKVGGTIFLRRGDYHTKEIKLSLHQKEIFELRSKQGMKFQLHLLSSSPFEIPDPSQSYVQWRNKVSVAMHASLGCNEILFESKIKCLRSPEDLQDLSRASFTDLRTNNRNSVDDIQWFKWLDFWGNYVISRFNKVVVGYVRNANEGMVRRLDVLEGEDLMRGWQRSTEKSSREFRPNPQVCFDFLDKLLGFIKTEMANAGPDDVYRLCWKKCAPVKLERVEESEQNVVLPGWFKNWLSKNHEN